MPGNVLGITGDMIMARIPHALQRALGEVTSLALVPIFSMGGLEHRVKTQD